MTVERLARRHRVSVAAVLVALGEPLPPIRFHDLRHGAATLSLAGGVDMKVVSETLGHAKSSFTSDVYTSVIPEVHRAAAEAVAAVVPLARLRRETAEDDRRLCAHHVPTGASGCLAAGCQTLAASDKPQVRSGGSGI